MRIAHVTNYQVPGYGYEEIHLARIQVEAGHQVAIFTSNFLHPKGQYTVLGNRFPDRQVDPREEREDGVRIIRLAASEIGYRVWIRGLTRAIARFQPDIVHSHNVLQFHPSRLAALKARGHGWPKLVVDDHMHYSVMRRGPVGRSAYFGYRRFLQPALEAQVDAFCAISEETRTYLSRECGVRGRIHLMPLGVDTERFHPDPQARINERERLGIPSDATVAIYTGKLIEPKGPHILVRAALSAIAAGHDIHVLLVGDADATYVGQINEAIEAAGHASRFHLLGSRSHDELPALYVAADIGVWPRQESMAIMEGMACGLPVVVAAGSGYAARVEAGAGLTYTADDSRALATALDSLASRERREAMGAAGRALVTDQLSGRRAAERYLELYASIVQPAPSEQPLPSSLSQAR